MKAIVVNPPRPEKILLALAKVMAETADAEVTVEIEKRSAE